MKTSALLLMLTACSFKYSFGQQDSIIIAKTSLDVRPIEWVVIIDSYIVYDTVISYPLLAKIADKIKRKKAYSPVKGYKKYGIVSKDGILVCFLKPGSDIDFKGMGIVDKINSP